VSVVASIVVGNALEGIVLSTRRSFRFHDVHYALMAALALGIGLAPLFDAGQPRRTRRIQAG
jgi:hypothetical protein